MNITVVMLVLYMALTIGISLVFVKKNNDTKGFMTAKGELGAIFIIPLLFSEMIAGAGTIGVAANGYNTGLSAVWANWGMSIGVILFIILVMKFYVAMNKVHGVISVPEAYKYLFDEKCRVVMLFVITIVYVILYSNQPIGVAAILGPLFGWNTTVIAWVFGVIFIAVTLSGGMKGIAFMNIIHALIMLIGMFVICFKALHTVGGWGVLASSLPSTYFSFAQPDVPTTIANVAGTSISMIAAATIVTVTFTAKDMKTAKIGAGIAAIIVGVFAFAVAVIGMCARIALPDIESNGALFNMADHLGGVFSGVASMAILAAIWSTAPALILISATTLTRDLYKRLKPDSTDKQELAFSRICIVVIGIVGVFLGLNAKSILDQMYGAFQIRSIVAITLIVALFWKKVPTRAAFWSMLLGGITAAVWFFAGNPLGIACFWPGAVVCLVIEVVLTLMSKEPVSEGYLRYQEALKKLESGELSN